MTDFVRSYLTAGLLFAVVLAARPAIAGPPLLCHPYDIGSARSLPWNGANWLDGKSDYDLHQLVADTQSLLGPQAPAIVRMETLRRAALYASRDARVAADLLARLTDRARAETAGGRARAFALLDAAYATEALRQVARIGGVTGYKDQAEAIGVLVNGRDASALMRESVAASPDDPSLQFAAALIAVDTDKAAYARYAERARARANADALLARNLSHLS